MIEIIGYMLGGINIFIGLNAVSHITPEKSDVNKFLTRSAIFNIAIGFILMWMNHHGMPE
jgi:hypothetical protein